MADDDDLEALKMLLLDILSDAPKTAEEIARELDARMEAVVGTSPARRERGH